MYRPHLFYKYLDTVKIFQSGVHCNYQNVIKHLNNNLFELLSNITMVRTFYGIIPTKKDSLRFNGRKRGRSVGKNLFRVQQSDSQ